jgi:hypothetical protein
MLDENFQQLKSMEEDGIATPGYVAEIINLFISNTKRILNDIAALLSALLSSSAFVILSRWGTHRSCLLCFPIRRNQRVVDYDMVDVLVRQLKGCSYRYNDDKPFLSLPSFNCIYMIVYVLHPYPVIQMSLSWACRSCCLRCCRVAIIK